MKALFVANIEMGENEGIYKKVEAEAQALGNILGQCDLVTKSKGKAKIKKIGASSFIEHKTVLDYVMDCVNESTIDFLYIRHMIPSPKLISMLQSAKKKSIKVYYEIPTYPYYWEQFKASRWKHRAIIKIGLDVIFWPIIYHYIDRLIVIRSNTRAKIYPKMVEITNGVSSENIQSKSYNNSHFGVFRMVAVGTLYPYHGYDRVLTGMAKCGESVGDTKIEFHVVGKSQTIDDLHRMADKLCLKNVFFHGIKTTAELNEMYEQFDVGLGCLALHRRNADIDTTLKVIEYYCRGVPVVTSGKSPLDCLDKKYTIHVPDDEDAIDINDIVKSYEKIKINQFQQLSVIAKEHFDWNNIMYELLEKYK